MLSKQQCVVVALLIGCFGILSLAPQASGEETQLEDILHTLFSTPKLVKLSTEKISQALDRAVALSPSKGASKLTVDRWNLAKELQALRPRDERMCYDYMQRVVYDKLKEHELIRAQIQASSSSSDAAWPDRGMDARYSNAHSFLTKLQELQETFCVEFLNSKASEAIASLDPFQTEAMLNFQAELRQRGVIFPANSAKQVAAAIWGSLKTLRPELSKLSSARKLSQMRDRFDAAFEGIVVSSCKSVKEKLTESTVIYLRGIVPMMEPSVRYWIDTERFCEQILESVQLYQELAYKAALKERSSS